MRRFIGCILVLLLYPACGSPGPAEVLGPVLKRLGEPGSTAALSRDLYEVLDTRARSVLDQRAAAMTKALGRPVLAWEVMQYRGMDPAFRVSGVELEKASENAATLKVTLTRVGGSNEGLMADPVRFEAVREDGAWKLSVPSIAEEVAKP